MKRTALALIAVLACAIVSMAADMTEIWNTIKSEKGMMVVDMPADKAREEGFESMTVAMNTAPTAEDIDKVASQIKFIDENQKLTSVTQEGVDVAIYATPADASGSLYKVLFVITSQGNEKSLICLYGTCTRTAMTKALSDLSIEEVIGG